MFADWLWRGLLSFYSSSLSEKINAFDEYGPLIVQQETVSEGLAQVYEAFIPRTRQLIFRQAIGDVLRDHANGQGVPQDAFQDLIYLIARIRATESLDALLPSVGNGALGRLFPGILYEALSVLRLLAPSNYAKDVALQLVDCSNFDDGYLFEAIKVIIECNPIDTTKTILRLHKRLNLLRNYSLEHGGEEWNAFQFAANDFAQTILTLAPTSLTSLWQQSTHLPEDTWLFELFISNTAIPVSFVPDPSSLNYLFEVNHEDKTSTIPVRTSHKTDWTRRLLERKLVFEHARRWVDNFQAPGNIASRMRNKIEKLTYSRHPDFPSNTQMEE
jgi:hypothetical protein